MADNAKPCCAVGAHDRIVAINEQLRSGTSLGTVALAFGLVRGTVGRHRLGCLNIKALEQSPRLVSKPETCPETPAKAADIQENILSVGSIARGEQIIDQPVKNVPVDVDVSAATLLERVERIATIIHLGQWRDRTSVLRLAKEWGVSQDVIAHLHRKAAEVAKLNRGGAGAQLETTIGILQRIRDDDLNDAREYLKEIPECMANKEFPRARTLRKMAAECRKSAMAAQAQIVSITLTKPPTMIRISAQCDPNFEEAWSTVRQVLDARYPGASAAVEQGLAALDDGGVEGFAAFLAGKGEGDAARVLTMGLDGSYEQ